MTPLESLAPTLSLLVIFSARLLELGTRRNTVAGSIKENTTLRLFILTGVVMLGSVLAERWLARRAFHGTLFCLGWGLAIASFVIRRQAIAALGRFWSLHVEIRERHELVRSGPFRWLRHPTYFSMLLELAAGPVLANAPMSLLVIPGLFCPVLWWRLRLEEKGLVDKFGAAYREYQQTTPALIPYKWPARP